MTNTFTSAQLDTLRNGYAHIERASVDHLPKFRALLADCGNEAIKQLIGARINFVSKLAVNEAVRRGIAA